MVKLSIKTNRRSKESGGKLATIGGRSKYSEDNLKGLYTELKEKLGLDLTNENVKLLKIKIE